MFAYLHFILKLGLSVLPDLVNYTFAEFCAYARLTFAIAKDVRKCSIINR